MKFWGGLVALVGTIILCGYIGLTSLFNITNPPPKPWILIEYTNISNPDTASFQNCEWSQEAKAIIPTEESKPFSFGYRFKNEYRIVSIDTTKSPRFDESAYYWGWVENDGVVFVYFPFDLKRIPIPRNAKFLRDVPGPATGEPALKQSRMEALSTKEMKRT